MNEQGYAEIILRFLRAVLRLDASLGGMVGLIGLLRGWHTWEAYGSALVWTGTIVMFVGALIGAGGLSARAEDVGAYTRSGAGNMTENMLQMAESRSSSLGCLFLLMIAGLGLIGVGYLLPFIPVLLR